MFSSSMLPFLTCMVPSGLLIGFVLIAVGIASRQPKMTNWGVAVIALVGVLILAALGYASFSRR